MRGDVTHLARRERQLDWPAFGVDKSMDFSCQPTSGTTETRKMTGKGMTNGYLTL